MTKLTYRDAGVDIDAGNELVRRIKPLAARTRRAEVRAGVGGFGALVDVPIERFKRPVLVSSTDGVGTKLRVALDRDQLDDIGIDLVAMCVNDVLTLGAEPLFFLDYYATGRLQLEQAERVLTGIARGCEQAGAALIGGETAEMPGMYAAGDLDLAGFCVGIVEAERIVDGRTVQPGDVLIGLTSSGAHANGYSLIRRIVDDHPGVPAQLDGQPFYAALLAPTRIYVKPVLSLLERIDVHAMAHITGGGLPENLPRVLPAHCKARLQRSAWRQPELFDWLARTGHVAREEMDRTFNCGLGFVLVVAAGDADTAMASLAASGVEACRIGLIEARGEAESGVVID